MARAKRQARRLDRHGFTIVEMLAVTIIIVVLVGVLLPAVQAAREAARRTQCGSNLAQIGFAVQPYHNAFGVLPAGTISEVLPVESYPNGSHHSWLVRLLPMLGEQPLAEQVEWKLSCYDPANWPVAVAEITTLQCASDWTYEQGAVGISSYAGVFDGRMRPIDEESRGLLIANRFLSRDDVPDGFTYTLLAGEKTVRGATETDLGWTSGTRATLRTTGYAPGEEAESSGVERGSGYGFPKTTARPYGRYLGDAEFDPAEDSRDTQEESDEFAAREEKEDVGAMRGYGESYDEDGLWSEPLLTEFPAPLPPQDRTRPGGFDSQHTGGVNMLWGDGRVGLVNEVIDEEVFAQMGMRDDGMPIQPLE